MCGGGNKNASGVCGPVKQDDLWSIKRNESNKLAAIGQPTRLDGRERTFEQSSKARVEQPFARSRATEKASETRGVLSSLGMVFDFGFCRIFMDLNRNRQGKYNSYRIVL